MPSAMICRPSDWPRRMIVCAMLAPLVRAPREQAEERGTGEEQDSGDEFARPRSIARERAERAREAA